MEQKIERMIFVFERIAYESGAANSYNPNRILVIVRPNTANIFYIIKGDIFQIGSLQIDGKL